MELRQLGLVWCVINSLRVPQAFLRQSDANATKHSDYVRKHLRQNAQKGRGNVMDLRDTLPTTGTACQSAKSHVLAAIFTGMACEKPLSV